jgi:hypothetical protein
MQQAQFFQPMLPSLDMLWSFSGYRAVRELISATKIEILIVASSINVHGI